MTGLEGCWQVYGQRVHRSDQGVVWSGGVGIGGDGNGRRRGGEGSDSGEEGKGGGGEEAGGGGERARRSNQRVLRNVALESAQWGVQPL